MSSDVKILRDPKRRISDFELEQIAEKNIVEKKSLASINRELGLSPNAASRAMKSERAKKYIEIAQARIIQSLPKVTHALTGLVNDYSTKETRKEMPESDQSRAFITCIKFAESAGILAGKQSVNVTNIYNQNNSNISSTVFNIIKGTLESKLKEVTPYEEVNYNE